MTLRTVPPPEENKIRGQAFRSALEVLDDVVGVGTHGRVLAMFPQELAEAYRYGAIVSSGWYPIAWFREMHATVRRVAPPGSNAAKKVAHAATYRDIRGVYQFILGMTSPSFAFKHSGRIIGTYVKNYGTKALEIEERSGRIEFELPGVNAEIWEVVCGAAEAVLSACGARNVTVATHPLDKPSRVILEAHWSLASSRG